jgi:hypothetical protein
MKTTLPRRTNIIALIALSMTVCGVARATEEFPSVIYRHLNADYSVSPYEPPCMVCHLRGSTGTGTAETPFARSMKRVVCSQRTTLRSRRLLTRCSATVWIVTAMVLPTFRRLSAIRIQTRRQTSAFQVRRVPMRGAVAESARTMGTAGRARSASEFLAWVCFGSDAASESTRGSPGFECSSSQTGVGQQP